MKMKMKKPTVTMKPTMNFCDAIHFMEYNGYPGIKDRVWGEWYPGLPNDSLFTMYLPDKDEEKEILNKTYKRQAMGEDLLAIKKFYKLGDEVIMEESW